MGGGKKDMDTGRKSVAGAYDPSGRKSRIPAAYPVTMLVDLQVYVIPREKWVLSRRLYRHNIVEEGISLGFVRVLPQLSIHNLRRELQLQLGPDVIPRDFIFIRAVGNIFIQLKPKQEIELKVKNFIPPFSTEPEIYLLEVLPNEDPRMMSPLPLLLREDTPPHICHDLCHHSVARKTVQIVKRDDSPQPTTPFPPVSITPSPSPYNPRTPFSPNEYHNFSKNHSARELTKSRADIAARQAAYEYDNEDFESPSPTPPLPVNSNSQSSQTEKNEGVSKPTLTRQCSVNEFESTVNDKKNETSIYRSNTQTTTDSPSSADTVRTAIRMDSYTTDNEKSTIKIESESMSKSINSHEKTEEVTETFSNNVSTKEVSSETHESSNTISSESKEHDELNSSDSQTCNSRIEDEHLEENVSNDPQEKSEVALTDVTDSQVLVGDTQSDSHDSLLLDEKDTLTASVKEAKSDLTNTEVMESSPQETLDSKEPDFVPESDTIEKSENPDHDSSLKNEFQEDSLKQEPISPEKSNPAEIDKEEAPKSAAKTLTNQTLSPTVGSSTSKTVKPKSTSTTKDVGNKDSKDKPGLTTTANKVRSARKVVDALQDAAEERDNESLKKISTSPKDKETEKELNESTKKATTKSKQYRDPRKPSIYPHRMTKTTIARQALAREKRRLYVEERIQRYMKDSKSSPSIMRAYGSGSPYYKSTISQQLDKEYAVGHSGTTIKDTHATKEKVDSCKYSHRASSITSTKDRKYSHLQSLPEINTLNDYMGSSYHETCERHYDPPETLSAISILRPPPYSYSASYARAGTSGISRSQSDLRSHTTIHSESRSSGIYVDDSNPEVTSNFWKNVSEQGFFYSFRVRQSGTVQMIDRAVQTGEQPQSYILDFARQSNGSYYLKSSQPLPQSSSFMHLPPINRDKLLRDITETVQLRHDAELRRAELIQRANDLQTMVKEKRDKINRRHEFWHKKYIEESSMTRPLEAACNSLRSELNTVHRRLIAHLEGRDLPLRLRDGPSKKANYKIMAARLQHEIKELQQKAKAAKLRLESEIKLKEQADREVRDIRNDLAHKKVVMSLARSQISLPAAAHARAYETLGY